jgi:shikimate kinase
MGTGKTTTGRIVARRLGWRFVDSDETIEAAEGTSISNIFEKYGEPAFRRIEHETVCRLADQDEIVIATGGGALINNETRAYVSARALVICLQAVPETLASRLSRDSERPLLKGDWRALFERRAPIYATIPHQIDTTGKTSEQVAEEVLALWQLEST